MGNGTGKPAWFPIYPAELLSDPAHRNMTAEQWGALFLLLCHQWTEGFIPEDIEEQARYCNCDASVCKSIARVFHKNEQGALVKRWLDERRKEVIGISAKRRDAALSRWEPDASAEQKQSKCNASAMQNENENENENENDIGILCPSASEGPPFDEIIDDLNARTGREGQRRFQSNSDTTRTLIRARWAEGNKLEEFRMVHKNMVSLWAGTNMEQHLQPTTLYRKSKFEGYALKKIPDVDRKVTGSQADDISF